MGLEPAKSVAEAEPGNGALKLRLSGAWRRTERRADAGELTQAHAGSREVRVEPKDLEAWTARSRSSCCS